MSYSRLKTKPRHKYFLYKFITSGLIFKKSSLKKVKLYF